MATATQLKALIRSHADGDDGRFYAIAMQVAAKAARNGHTKFANDIRELVDLSQNRCNSRSTGMQTKPVPLAQPRGELSGLLTATYPDVRLNDMALGESIRLRIERILLEQRQRKSILEYGLAPIRKLLFIGPPGTGKTMTASMIACELAVPLLTIQLDGLITKYLGETAAKLRMIFDAIQQNRAVYLFDEFDALGGNRATLNEVGEIRRVLNSFLQFLENDASDSIIVAATNYSNILDHALFRRFDDVVEYALPDPDIAMNVVRSRLSIFDTSRVEWPKILPAADGLSHADLTSACEQAAKKSILENNFCISTELLTNALSERQSSRCSPKAE